MWNGVFFVIGLNKALTVIWDAMMLMSHHSNAVIIEIIPPFIRKYFVYHFAWIICWECFVPWWVFGPNYFVIKGTADSNFIGSAAALKFGK